MGGQTLQRLLGKGFSMAACVGLIIGLGILRTPGEIAAVVSDPLTYMALWIGGGLFVLLSLLVVAELIALTPRSGGTYALVAHAYGPYPAFVIGWTDWIATCAVIALKAVVLIEYLTLLVPSLAPYQPAAAIVATSAFALLQLGGTRLGAGVQEIASTGIGLFILGLGGALFYGFLSNGGPVDVPPTGTQVAASGLAGYGLVMSAIIFTYDGWYAASYFGGEMKSGARAVAVGSLQATMIVITLFVMLNLALVLSVPLSALSDHELALAGALDLVLGGDAGRLVIVAAVFILLAHQNLNYMMASRVLYSLSIDGFGSRRATTVTEKGTPAGGVIFTWATVVALILAGQFEFLLRLTAMLFVIMYLALVMGVFRLRRQKPDADRPFRAWGFPVTGIICTLGWMTIVVFVGVTGPESALYGAALILISAPVYLWLKRHRHLPSTTNQASPNTNRI